jgi:hypothetical protein
LGTIYAPSTNPVTGTVVTVAVDSALEVQLTTISLSRDVELEGNADIVHSPRMKKTTNVPSETGEEPEAHTPGYEYVGNAEVGNE